MIENEEEEDNRKFVMISVNMKQGFIQHAPLAFLDVSKHQTHYVNPERIDKVMQ